MEYILFIDLICNAEQAIDELIAFVCSLLTAARR